MEKIFEQINKVRIMPVAVIENPEDADPIANALIAGNIPAIEVTMRTSTAAESISRISKNKDIMVGAGTVLTTEQVDIAIKAGAQFIVAPNLNKDVVKYSISKDIPVIPGIATCTETQQAAVLGLRILKFFPAELNGGVKMLKTFGSVFPDLQFMPTGGLNLSNFKDYLSLPNVIACGGSFMLPKKSIQEKEFTKITDICKDIIQSL